MKFKLLLGLLCVFLFSLTSKGQIIVTEPERVPLSVNNSGLSVDATKTINDYFNDTSYLDEDPLLVRIDAINSKGDLGGFVRSSSDEDGIIQLGYKLADQDEWKPIPYFEGTTEEDKVLFFGAVHSISENGRYFTGIMSANENINGFIYRYDTELDTLINFNENIPYENSRAYKVLDDGSLYGSVEVIVDTFGTIRIPAYFDANGQLYTLMSPEDATNAINEIFDVTSNGNIMVGIMIDRPFIYHRDLDSFQFFDFPEEYTRGAFTSIADDGTVVGYFENGRVTNTLDREAIVYHSSMGDSLMLLKDYLEERGIFLPSENPLIDTKLGTASKISSNGKYIIGFENRPAFIGGRGWIVNLDNPTSSTKEINEEYTLKVYPNPSADNIVLEIDRKNGEVFNNELTLNIIDAQGKLMLSTSNFDRPIDVSNLISGTYIAVLKYVKSGRILSSSRFIVNQ